MLGLALKNNNKNKAPKYKRYTHYEASPANLTIQNTLTSSLISGYFRNTKPMHKQNIGPGSARNFNESYCWEACSESSGLMALLRAQRKAGMMQKILWIFVVIVSIYHSFDWMRLKWLFNLHKSSIMRNIRIIFHATIFQMTQFKMMLEKIWLTQWPLWRFQVRFTSFYNCYFSMVAFLMFTFFAKMLNESLENKQSNEMKPKYV